MGTIKRVVFLAFNLPEKQPNAMGLKEKKNLSVRSRRTNAHYLENGKENRWLMAMLGPTA